MTANGRLAVRLTTPEDLPFLAEMLAYAAFPPWAIPSPEEALEAAHSRRYLEGWGRQGDVGVVAEEEGRRVGAAWCRVVNEEPVAPGDVPELAIALIPEARGRRIGTALLRTLMDEAMAHGFPAISLRVSPSNEPALRLYRSVGFERLGGTDDHPTMIVLLPVSQ